MKYLLSILFLTMLTSCVTTSKHHKLFASYELTEKALRQTEDQLLKCEDMLAEKKYELEVMDKEKNHLNDKIKTLDASLQFAHKSNQQLNERVAELTGTAVSNTDIMKKTIEELSFQSLKNEQLTSALVKKDSINYLLTRKAKSKMSDKKLKKSLEKLGFVFY
jgi:chromosome segregation ATPase